MNMLFAFPNPHSPCQQVIDLSKEVEHLKHELRKSQSSMDDEQGAVGGAPLYDVTNMSQSEAEQLIVDMFRSKTFSLALQSVSSLK